MIRAIHLPQQAEKNIKHDHITRVPNMGAVVHGGSTQIHAQVIGINWRKHLFCAAH